jgi:3-(3-hydroxy-phenyl)propionate hydroxylase
MHQPSQQRRPSAFYEYEVRPYRRSADRDGRAEAPVVIVGAGPIGLLAALGLARFGVASIVLEEDVQVSHGSRAIVLVRRSLEVLQQLGIDRPFRAKGLPWSFGRSFYRGTEIYRMVMPHDEDDRFLPGLNIQQQYTEEYLIEACASDPLIDLRFGQKLVELTAQENRVSLRIDTPEGEHDLHAEWVVAADGGRSAVRRLLGLRMEGRAYAGNFVIADIRADIDLPTERLCYFDPAWNLGNNVLVHRQPDSVWRIDFRLPDGETPEAALEPALLRQRIDAVLSMIGKVTPWELDWATVYSPSALTLPEYVHGRVALVGDAAHLLPIFGVRGCNTGIQDCHNLAWKLAFVVKGWSGRDLLESYSSECVAAARQICEEAGKSTRFMTPPTRGFRLMRDAVLSLSLSEDFAKDLLHWRTSRPHQYHGSPLNGDDEFEPATGVAVGEAARNVKLAEDDYLFDRLAARPGFCVLAFAGADGVTPQLASLLVAAAEAPFPVIRAIIGAHVAGLPGELAELTLEDRAGRIARKYAAAPGSVYLLRPDRHVCARWRCADPARLRAAFRSAVALARRSVRGAQHEPGMG